MTKTFNFIANAAVYPSLVPTVLVASDDTYAGAHTYLLQKTTGFANGQTNYIDEHAVLQFVQKDTDGTVISGVLSEQVILALIDRHQKLDEVFPSPHNVKAIAGLQQFLDAQQERVDERVQRGVMGELKK